MTRATNVQRKLQSCCPLRPRRKRLRAGGCDASMKKKKMYLLPFGIFFALLGANAVREKLIIKKKMFLFIAVWNLFSRLGTIDLKDCSPRTSSNTSMDQYSSSQHYGHAIYSSLNFVPSYPLHFFPSLPITVLCIYVSGKNQ